MAYRSRRELFNYYGIEFENLGAVKCFEAMAICMGFAKKGKDAAGNEHVFIDERLVDFLKNGLDDGRPLNLNRDFFLAKAEYDYVSSYNELLSENGVNLRDIACSMHGRYVGDRGGKSVFEAFLNLQRLGVMQEYAKRFSQSDDFDKTLDDIIEEITLALIPKDENGKRLRDNEACVGRDRKGRLVITEGNNRLIKLKFFNAVRIVRVLMTPMLSEEERKAKLDEIYNDKRNILKFEGPQKYDGLYEELYR